MIWKHIYLDKCFLFFLIIIILTGNFNNFFPYFSLLFLHELGHALTGIILGYQLDKIMFYPYGGITIFNLPINIPLKKELLILVMGPVFQVVAYLFLKKYYPQLYLYHYTLLIFNLLPIYPLDGGKIFNILCGYFINYLKCFYWTFLISLIIVFFLFFYLLYQFNLNLFLTLIVIFFKLIDFYRKRFFYYQRFLLERYLHNYHFKRIKIIHQVNDFYRDCKHYINYEDEKKYLKKYFN